MTDLRPSARVWVDLVVLAAVVATLAGHQVLPAQANDWSAVAILLICASVAHAFPIRPAFDNVTYHLTSSFMVAAAMLLSPAEVALVAAAALAPDLWRRRSVPGIRVLWIFNAAQTTIATLVALAWLRWTGTHQLDGAADALALLAAVGLFTFAQALLVGVVVALNSRKPLLACGTFSATALASDFAIGLGGLLVGGLWLVKPALLLSLPPLLFLLHRATRSVHLAELVDRDPKTGLYNARFLERALEQALVRAHTMNRPVTVLFADLDHFKQVNDRQGHDAGDQVLREVAHILQAQARHGDIVARFGGEEFVVLVTGATEEAAFELAERIRRAVEQHELRLPDGNSLSCTISIGMASAPRDANDTVGLLRHADA